MERIEKKREREDDDEETIYTFKVVRSEVVYLFNGKELEYGGIIEELHGLRKFILEIKEGLKGNLKKSSLGYFRVLEKMKVVFDDLYNNNVTEKEIEERWSEEDGPQELYSELCTYYNKKVAEDIESMSHYNEGVDFSLLYLNVPIKSNTKSAAKITIHS